MKEIPLTQGKIALVDDEDFERLSMHKQSYSGSGAFRYRNIRMSHEILQTNEMIDHKDGDNVNYQKFNLRICTYSQNNANRRPRQGCTSKHKGVYWREDRSKWSSRIHYEEYLYHLGCYEDERQAAFFYDIAAVHFFGEFARLNFPENIEFIKQYWKEKEIEDERSRRC